MIDEGRARCSGCLCRRRRADGRVGGWGKWTSALRGWLAVSSRMIEGRRAIRPAAWLAVSFTIQNRGRRAILIKVPPNRRCTLPPLPQDTASFAVLLDSLARRHGCRVRVQFFAEAEYIIVGGDSVRACGCGGGGGGGLLKV